MALQTKQLIAERTLGIGLRDNTLILLYLLLFFSFFGIPLIPVIWFWSERTKRKDVERVTSEANAVFREFIGEDPKYLDVAPTFGAKGHHKLTASAIAIRGDEVFIMDNGVATSFPWTLVREWEWQIEGKTQYYGRTGIGGLQDMVMTQEAAANAYRQSGLFIRVADIDHPEWQFTSDDKAVLNKWHEILQQKNETADAKTDAA